MSFCSRHELRTLRRWAMAPEKVVKETQRFWQGRLLPLPEVEAGNAEQLRQIERIQQRDVGPGEPVKAAAQKHEPCSQAAGQEPACPGTEAFWLDSLIRDIVGAGGRAM